MILWIIIAGWAAGWLAFGFFNLLVVMDVDILEWMADILARKGRK